MGRGGVQDCPELIGRVDLHLAALRLDLLELLRRRGPALGEVIVGQGEGKQELYVDQHRVARTQGNVQIDGSRVVTILSPLPIMALEMLSTFAGFASVTHWE